LALDHGTIYFLHEERWCAMTPTLRTSGNPVFPGWYADPEIHCFDGRYYLYPTTSRPFAEQTTFEC
jgi:hypothetical protein